MALDIIKESKGKHPKQPDEKEREVVYSQMAQNIEKTRNEVTNSISRASTISAEEQQMALTEKEFSMIKKKMDKIVEAWYSLEQYIGLKEDKLSSTTVDFIRSEGNLETKRLYWFSKPKMF